MEQHNITLPKHWRKVTLDDIGVIASGGTPSTKDIEFWGDDIHGSHPLIFPILRASILKRGREAYLNLV